VVYALFARRLLKTKTAGTFRCPPRYASNETLLEFFGHQRKLQFRLGRDFTTKPSADSEVVFRAAAIWLKI
jgi:hypothetical protein